MIKNILLIAALLVMTSLKSQQLQTSSMYDMQGVLHNPSMAGLTMRGMFGVSYRSQWTGVTGSPKTATVFGSLALPKHNIGLGAYIYSDKTGATSRTGMQVAFAKHIPLKNGGKFSLGIEVKGLQYSIDMQKLEQDLGNDPILGSGSNKFKFDAGFGVSYSGHGLVVGASVSQLIQSKLGYYTGNLTTTEQAKLYRHYYLNALYKWPVDETTVITPHFLMIYLPNSPTEFQGGVRVEHDKLFWWGLAWRVQQSWTASAGINVNKKMTIGYAFDLYSTPYSVYEKGSSAHELLLRYNLYN
jgi:type IX secretion system PorP/SprF family membrane protein